MLYSTSEAHVQWHMFRYDTNKHHILKIFEIYLFELISCKLEILIS